MLLQKNEWKQRAKKGKISHVFSMNVSFLFWREKIKENF